MRYSVLYLPLICCMIALLATSCLDEVYEEDNATGGLGDNLSLITYISLPDQAGQKRSLAGTEIGTSYTEILIDSIRAVFYNGEGKVEYSFDMQIALNANSPTDFSADGFDVLTSRQVGNIIEISTRARTFKPGSYEMLVVVNPNHKIREMTRIGDSKDLLKEPFEVGEEEDYSLYKRVITDGPAFFLMQNAGGLVTLTQSDFKKTPEEAEANPVSVNVERAVVKVDCTNEIPNTLRSNITFPHGRFVIWVDPSEPGDRWDIPDDCLICPACDSTYNRISKKCVNGHSYSRYDGLGLVSEKVLYAVATDFLWQVDVINRKSFWFRQFTGDESQEKGYAQDPNFDSGWRSSPGNFISDNFVYIDSIRRKEGKGRWARRLTPSTTYSSLWTWDVADPLPVYIPENTMDTPEQQGDVATRVVFQAVLRREFSKSSKPGEEIGDFFVFHGGLSNSNGRYDNIIDADGTFFYIIRPEDMAKYAAGTLPFPDNLDSESATTRLSKEVAQSKLDGFNFADWESQEAAKLTDNLAFYKNSTLYYAVPVEHFGISSIGGYGRFGVVRNHRYTLNIQTIRSIGEPVIPKPAAGLLQ